MRQFTDAWTRRMSPGLTLTLRITMNYSTIDVSDDHVTKTSTLPCPSGYHRI